ncbi:MAG: hypothetical protein U9N57_14165 [Pseudomonadota bacterium]|nr:hypothetical protein [Pseudomonadota bacterium]
MKVDGIEWTSIISPKEIIDGMANNACWSSEPCMDFTTNEYTMGHNCCIKSNKEYQTIFSDLNVIAPVASSVAKYRNLRTAGQPKSTFTFGACHFSVDGEHYKQTLRSLGIEARTRLFLNKIYGIQFSKPVLEKAKMDAELYPPTYYEKSLSRAIRDIQGVGNPFTIDDWKKKKPTPYRNQEAVNLLDKIGELADINATNQK